MDIPYLAKLIAIGLPIFILEIFLPFGLRNYLRSDVSERADFANDAKIQKAVLNLTRKYNVITRTVVIAYTLIITSLRSIFGTSAVLVPDERMFLAIGALIIAILSIPFALFFHSKLEGGPPPADVRTPEGVTRRDRIWRSVFLGVRLVMYASNGRLILLSP